MAVIKIVPMPGAEGQKGDEGATGAQGPQGPIGPAGPAGADALWSYNGAWQSNATYAEGDLVTHDGQLYYATGVTTLGVTPDSDSNFDLIAAKGESADIGIHEHLANVFPNGLVVEGYIGDPEVNPAGTMALSVQGGGYTALMDLVAEDATFNGSLYVSGFHPNKTTIIETPTTINNDLSVEGFSKTPGAVADALKVKGITNDGPGNLYIGASDTIWLTANNGEYIDRPYGPEDRQIAALGDIKAIFESGTWDHDFFEESGLTTSTYDTISDYYKIGELVYFDLSVNLGYVTNWGSPVDLGGGVLVWPLWTFKLPYPVHSYGSAHNSAITNIIFTGTIFDTSLAEDISERTANDQGSNVIFGKLSQSGGNTYVNIYTVSQSESAGTASGELRAVTSVYPKDFTQPANIQTGPAASRLRISGTYRTA